MLTLRKEKTLKSIFAKKWKAIENTFCEKK